MGWGLTFLSFMPAYQNSRAIYIRALLLHYIIQAANSNRPSLRKIFNHLRSRSNSLKNLLIILTSTDPI